MRELESVRTRGVRRGYATPKLEWDTVTRSAQAQGGCESRVMTQPSAGGEEVITDGMM